MNEYSAFWGAVTVILSTLIIAVTVSNLKGLEAQKEFARQGLVQKRATPDSNLDFQIVWTKP